MRKFNFHWRNARNRRSVTKRVRPTQHLSRKPSLESLETRQLLAANFEITDGDAARHFMVDTVFDAEGNPNAVIRIAGDPQNARSTEGELELSLRVDDAIVDKYRVRIFFPSQYVLDGLRAHRDDLAEQMIRPLDAEDAVDKLALLDADGRFTDLKAEEASFAPVAEDIPFNPEDPDVDWSIDVDALRAIAERDWALETFERLARLVQSTVTGSLRVTDQELGRLFSSLEASISDLSDGKIPSDGRLAEQLSIRSGALLTELFDSLESAANGNNKILATAADSLRATLLGRSHLAFQVWTGHGINSDVLVEDHSDKGELHYSVFYETGEVELKDDVSIDIGRPASVTLIDPQGMFSDDQSPEARPLLLGPPTDSAPLNEDAFIKSDAPNTNYGNNFALRTRHYVSGYDWESFLKFDLSSFSQEIHTAELALYVDYVAENSGQPNPNAAVQMVYDNDWIDSPIGEPDQFDWQWVDDNWNPDAYGPILDAKTLSPSDDAQSHTWDITLAAREAVRFGDMNFDGQFDATGGGGDFAAFELYLRDPDAYHAQYDVYMTFTNDLLYRSDANHDGAVNALDAKGFLDRLGFPLGDFNFDGVVDSNGDYAIWTANSGTFNATYAQGDIDFDGDVDGDDLLGLLLEFGQGDTTVADPTEVTLRVHSTVDSGRYIKFSSADQATNPKPKLIITEAPDILITDFSANGTDFLLSYHVRDVGIAPNPFDSGLDIKVYRSDDMVFDGADQVLMTETLVSPDLSDGGHDVSFAATSGFPDDADDDYYLIAVIDGSDVYDEAQEQNNALVFQGGAFVVDTGTSRTLHVHGTEDADDLGPRIIDDLDGSPHFVTTTGWTSNPVYTSYTYNERRLLANGSTGSKMATWTFEGLLPGMYQVAATWQHNFSNRNTGAPYSVYDGDTATGTLRDSEQHNHRSNLYPNNGDLTVPDPFDGLPVPFKHVGDPVLITSGTLSVRLTDETPDGLNWYTVADAIHLVRVENALDKVIVRSHGGNDTVTPWLAVPFSIHGGDGDDTLTGTAGNDLLDGGGGADVLFGLAGDDTYQFTGLLPGFDTIREATGEGTDTLDFSKLDDPIGVDLEKDLLVEGAVRLMYENATDRALENIIGTPGDDSIAGNDLANNLVGGDGVDTLEGRGGNDVLDGGDAGDFYIFAGSQNLGIDMILEDAVDSGRDLLDFHNYVDAGTGGIAVDLDASNILVTSQLWIIDFNGEDAIEGVIGTMFDDVLRGNAGDNYLNGMGGDDDLYGRDGDDVLIGTDATKFYGGKGFDVPELVDNDDAEEPQFEELTGSWTPDSSNGFNGNQQWAAASSGSEVRWLFEDGGNLNSAPPTTGSVGVYATWDPVAGGATNASTPFTVTDSAGSFSQSFGVNFAQTPSGTGTQIIAGRAWQLLGTFSNLTNGLRVILDADNANGTVVADGIMLLPNPLPAPEVPEQFVHVDSQDLLMWMHSDDAMLGVDGYEIERSKTGLGDWEPWVTINDPMMMSTDPATDPVNERETYFYRIRAFDDVRGTSDWSAPRVVIDGEENFAVKLSAIASTSPQPQITLQWAVQKDHFDQNHTYKVYRKDLNGTFWGDPIATDLPANASGLASWSDTSAQVGAAYEYRVDRNDGRLGVLPNGTIYAGIEVPLKDNRGTILLVVDERLFQCDPNCDLGNPESEVMISELTTEFADLRQDLVGDGWKVTLIIADPDPATTGVEDSGQAVSAVKEAIKDEYDAQGSDVKAVFLLGNVPVPYSGSHNPDDHGNRTLPADTYYGDVDAPLVTNPNNGAMLISDDWSDHDVIPLGNVPGTPTSNVVGDGRFDQTLVPFDFASRRNVELLVGRVDLSNMDEDDFSADTGGLTGHALEVELLRRYLEKDHEFRHGIVTLPEKAFLIDIDDRPNTGPRFHWWNNFSSVVGHEQVDYANWLALDNMGTLAFTGLFASASSSGGDHRTIRIEDGTGDVEVSTSEIAANTTSTVFHAISGSYLMDWNRDNSLMKALLANDGYGLTAQWHFLTAQANYLHMAMGETIGFAHQVSQGGLTGTTTETWEDLLGDPTLRMHVVKPAINVDATDIGGGNVQVIWSASPDSVIGYHVYRRDQSSSEYVRVTQSPTTQLSRNVQGTVNDDYMVRAVKLETSNAGTYFNASQGVFFQD